MRMSRTSSPPSFGLLLRTAGSKVLPRGDGAKRLMDLLVGGVLLTLSLPVQAVVAIAVRTDSAGPALHRAVRTGRYGKPFTIFKFRTMVVDAAGRGPMVTGAGDPRVTRAGRLLRKTKLDELPQLWNVVRGDMSLVGPRPEDPRVTALYSPEQIPVLSIRPGITGVSQLAFRHEARLLGTKDPESAYVREILPRKLSLDLDYVRQRSLRTDTGILLRTLRALIS